jgi:hypothetical protein
MTDRETLIPSWLFGIQTGRVKEEIRPNLIRYRRECFRVLWDAFKPDILPQLDPALALPAEELTPAERALVLAEAVTAIARQQVAYERVLAHHDQRLDKVEDAALEAHARIDALEPTIEAGPTVTTAQAAVISGAVTLAPLALSARTSVREVQVRPWLVDWWKAITAEPAPFGAHDVGGQLGMELG